MTALAIALALVAGGVAFYFGRPKPRAVPIEGLLGPARRESAALVGAAQAEAESQARQAELDARTAALAELAAAEANTVAAEEELGRRALQLERRSLELDHREGTQAQGREALALREQALQERDTQIRAARTAAAAAVVERQREIERLAGESADDVQKRLIAEWIEGARAAAAERVRRVEAGVNDPEHGRTAERLMTIAAQRYEGHYLTERLLTNVPLVEGALARIAGPDNEILRIIEEVTNVKLLPSETGDAIRLDGQDSFGREIARRAIARFSKSAARPGEARKSCELIAVELDREVMELGKKAFKELAIPRAHPDLVKLVGKLNYRTSYTQNQWKHAIEAAFLCGLIAQELGLDVRLARRAALLHDIGKALTHEIDGSHAVIGADLARQRGEDEVVANAIGAHHGDEPFNSPYALLVAATDAMSGARPGARRQQDDNYAERIGDLERLTAGRPGVERVYVVHGGREVRIHVKQERVTDERAVALSSEIARQISDELVFPGQIKVTVIREVKATAVAN